MSSLNDIFNVFDKKMSTNIKKVFVKNFKSFDEEEIELTNFNILIGSNASGKSNFIEILKFLKNIQSDGLLNAISMQGEHQFLKNLNLNEKETRIKIKCDNNEIHIRLGIIGKGMLFSRVNTFVYEFSFIMDENSVIITSDTLKVNCSFIMLEISNLEEFKENLYKALRDRRKGNKEQFDSDSDSYHISLDDKNLKYLGEADYTIIKKDYDCDLKVDINPEKDVNKEDYDKIFPLYEKNEIDPLITKKNSLLIEKLPLPLTFMSIINRYFKNIKIFDIDPKLSKTAVGFSGKRELEQNGGNLPIVLRNLLQNKKKKSEFLSILNDIIPFVKDVEVETFADRYLTFGIKESFSNKKIPAFLLSDGTIALTALIIAVFFESDSMIIIEEPERNIHPSLISKLVSVLEEQSENQQILITTHNPELIKNAKIEDILLIKRNDKGHSTIIKPSNSQKVKTFLQNEIGIDELYIQNLLGA